MRPAHTPSNVKGSISKWVVSLWKFEIIILKKRS